MRGIEIRKAQISDLADILALYRQPEMDGEHVLPIDEAEAVFQRISSYPSYAFYIAIDEQLSEVVGVFSLLVMDNLGHQGTPSAIVEGVCVAEDRQDRGIGKMMMVKAKELSRQAGCYKLSLSSNLRRERAHDFYRGLGFKQHGLSFYTEL